MACSAFAHRFWMQCIALCLLCGTGTVAVAAGPTTLPVGTVGAASKPATTVRKTESVAGWMDLTDSQKIALAPLEADWPKIEPARKKKWLAISNRYAQMNPDEQQRLHQKMREWVKLTPEQRRVAREVFARSRKLAPDQKSEKWAQYQSLPAEEKQRLAADIAARNRVANLPTIKNHHESSSAPKVLSKPNTIRPAVAASTVLPLPAVNSVPSSPPADHGALAVPAK